MKSIIRARGLGKQYRIGVSRSSYPTLRETLGAFQLPFRGAKNRNGGGGDDKFWALKDVDFEVMPGEVVGIIGRNGAGKSTLLKILSRITEPTTGRIELYGRVGSLLEVGTGFHPELTGMENIYLNGAILGMSRREIDSKFDEIVAFAEIEKFLGTPVKRYSSGMYMRLAFAVAAHLEPEILIVDEVLAVGDAAFQKKCIGKMSNVAKKGRTVLFVSHNMSAVRTLCKRGILIDSGGIELDSDVEACITRYLAEHDASDAMKIWPPESAPQTPEIRFTRGYVSNHRGEIVSQLDYRNEFVIALEYEVLKPVRNLRVGFFLQTVDGMLICGSNDPEAWSHVERGPGCYVSKCVFPGSLLNAGTYVVSFGSDSPPGTEALIHPRPSLNFVVEVMEGHGPFNRVLPGVIRPKLHWEIEEVAH
jgi:lipopolysaccharide transport system ATP-binding protein